MSHIEHFLNKPEKYSGLQVSPTCQAQERNTLLVLKDIQASRGGTTLRSNIPMAQFYRGTVHDLAPWFVLHEATSIAVVTLVKNPRSLSPFIHEFGVRNGIVPVGDYLFAANVEAGSVRIVRPVQNEFQSPLRELLRNTLSKVDIDSLPFWTPEEAQKIFPK